MWKEYMDKIKEEKNKYDETINEGADDMSIATLNKELKRRFGFEMIYGVLEMNSIWYENEDQKSYLFLGESNLSWYVYRIETNEYLELDHPSGNVLEKYDNFEGMFSHMLEESLL